MTLAQRNFSGGEIAPAFWGRTDFPRVQAGLQECRNWLVERSGAVANRSGFEYRVTGKGATSHPLIRIVPSVRDLTSTYVLELGHQYCRVMKAGSPVSAVGAAAWDPTLYQPPGTIVTSAGSLWYSIAPSYGNPAITLVLGGTGPYTLTATGGTPFVSGDAGHAWALYDPDGNIAVITLGTYVDGSHFTGCTVLTTVLADPLAVPNSLPASLDPLQYATPTTVWSSPLAPSAGAYWYQLTSTVVEFPTPWADNDLNALNYAQSVDVMSFVHPSYPSTKIKRYSDTRWQVVTVATEPPLLAPTGGVAVRANAAGGPFTYVYQYQVTAVDAYGNESDPSAVFSCVNVAPTAAGAGGYGNFLQWNMVLGAVSYNVYRQASPGSSIYGFILTVSAASLPPTVAVSGLAAVGGNAAKTPADKYLVTAWTTGGQGPAETAGVAATVGQADAANPVSVSWTAFANATAYWIYRLNGNGANPGLYCLVATVTGATTSITDGGLAQQTPWSLVPGPATPATYQVATQDLIINPDVSTHPGVAGSLDLTTRRPSIFSSTNNYPAVVVYFQQRYVFAQTNLQPEYVWMSRAGNYDSFASTFPEEADDAIVFQVNGYRINPVRHMVDMGALLLFTDNGVYSVQGGTSGLTPTELSVHQENYVGCQGGVANLAPIIYDNTAVYMQARGNIVRSIHFDLYTNGYRGDNQSMYSQHLLDGFTIPAWTWAEVPGNILWAARSDGALLAMTFIPEQQITGWSRHDTAGGAFEYVCAVPEIRQNGSSEDVLYAVVRRVVNGSTVRTIERMASRLIVDPKSDPFFMDCGTKFDGRIPFPALVQISTGTTWVAGQTLTLTANIPFTNVAGTVYDIYDATGFRVRFIQATQVTTYVVTGTADVDVPVSLQGPYAASYALAVSSVTAPQLAGMGVSVLADGVVLSPDKDGNPTITADGSGVINLGGLYEVVNVGLPIVGEIQTLDIEAIQPTQTMTDKQRMVQKLTVRVDDTVGIQVGVTGHLLEDPPIAVAYDAALSGYDGVIDIEPQSEWDRSGSVTIRQIRPLPARLLSVGATVSLGE